MANTTLNYLIVMPLMRSSSNESYILPLGILYISSSMKKIGFNVNTLNLNHCPEPIKKLKETIQTQKIDVILSGGMSPQYNEIKDIFDAAKEANENIITICGGGLVAGDPIPAMTALEVDYGIIGEGEATAIELCTQLEANSHISKVSGIAYKANDEIILTKNRSAITEIDEIPWPDYEGFNFKEFLETSTIGTNGVNCQRAGMIITSRSCPFSCTFCFHTSGRKYRQRSMDNVFEEIDYIISKYNIEFLYISDELFSQSTERVNEFCRRIKPYNIPWNASFRVDGINDHILKLLKDSNCASIGIGIESADKDVLKSMNKRVTIEQIESALEKIYNAQIPVVGNFIFGDVAETVETAQNTIEWWKKNQKYGIFMKMIKVYPGTKLYQHAVESDIIKDPVQFLKDGCPPLNVSQMTSKEMGELVTQITLLPLQENARVQNAKLDSASITNGNCDLEGLCHYCGKKNLWQSVGLFSLNYITCHHCNEKLATSVPDKLIQTIDSNLDNLIDKGEKVALWGMADYAMEYLAKSKTIKNNPQISLIDLSSDKQLMILGGKKVEAPAIIESQQISTVVVLVPVFCSTIKSQIDLHFPGTTVIPITDLFTKKA